VYLYSIEFKHSTKFVYFIRFFVSTAILADKDSHAGIKKSIDQINQLINRSISHPKYISIVPYVVGISEAHNRRNKAEHKMAEIRWNVHVFCICQTVWF